MAFGTVEALTEEGAITPRGRVTADNLDWAATWLEAYEGDTDTDREVLTVMATVAASLRRQAQQAPHPIPDLKGHLR